MEICWHASRIDLGKILNKRESEMATGDLLMIRASGSCRQAIGSMIPIRLTEALSSSRSSENAFAKAFCAAQRRYFSYH
jgi:hypothetical protein